MNYLIDIQRASDDLIPYDDNCLINWAKLPLMGSIRAGELTLRLVNKEEIQHLNATYRGKNQPTNVLAFPYDIPKHIELECPLLGDIIVCPAVLKDESIECNRPLDAHWAHIIIHGVLHLLGYDHIEEEDAKVMKDLEIQLLRQLNFANPYETEGD